MNCEWNNLKMSCIFQLDASKIDAIYLDELLDFQSWMWMEVCHNNYTHTILIDLDESHLSDVR